MKKKKGIKKGDLLKHQAARNLFAIALSEEKKDEDGHFYISVYASGGKVVNYWTNIFWDRIKAK